MTQKVSRKAELEVTQLGHENRTENVFVPGTVQLVEQKSLSTEVPGNIVLFPQPSDDPEDPLNWSKYRKWFNMFLIQFYALSITTSIATIYSILVPIAQDINVTVAELNDGIGFMFLLAGWSNLMWQPLAVTFGRRLVFLTGLLGSMITSEWAAHIDCAWQWDVARCLFGFLSAPLLVLPQLCVTEVFFAHERGTWTGVYMFTFAGSCFVSPMIAGFLNDAYGWKWVQHWGSITIGVCLILFFFCYEDTMYQRGLEKDKPEQNSADWQMSERVLTTKSKRNFSSHYHKLTFCEKMKPWRINPLINRHNFIEMVWRPIYIFFTFPIIAWCGFMYGIGFAWYNVYNALSSSILSGPPYYFRSSAVGLNYLSPLVGALIGGFISGPVSDWTTLQLARRNGGVREPEQRLWGLVLYNIVIPGALLLLGLGAYYNVHWTGLVITAGLIAMCNVLAGSYSLSYLVDSYKDISSESLVSCTMFRNTISFAFHYAITPWIDHSGLKNAFIELTAISVVTGLTFLIFIWKGKILRRATAKKYWKLVENQISSH